MKLLVLDRFLREVTVRNSWVSRWVDVARLSGSGSKQRRINALASVDMDSGISGWILNIPTWTYTQHKSSSYNSTLIQTTKKSFFILLYKQQFSYFLDIMINSIEVSVCDLEHGCLWFSQFIEGWLPRGHFNDSTAQRPDICWLSVPARPFIYDFRSHVL